MNKTLQITLAIFGIGIAMGAGNELNINTKFKSFPNDTLQYETFSDGEKKTFDGHDVTIDGGNVEINVGDYYLRQTIKGSTKKSPDLSVDQTQKIYSNVVSDVSLKLKIAEKNVKEYVLVEKEKEVRWVLDTNLAITKSKGRQILEFYDSNRDCIDPECKKRAGNPIIYSDRFIAIDSDNNTYNLDFSLEGNEVVINNYPKDIKFPIVIDPSYRISPISDFHCEEFGSNYPNGAGITFDSNGIAYMACQSSFDPYSFSVYKSTDTGKTWTKIVDKYTLAGSYLGSVSMDRNNNFIVYYVYRQNGGSNPGRKAEYMVVNGSGMVSTSSIYQDETATGIYYNNIIIDKDNNYYFGFETSSTPYNYFLYKWNGSSFSVIKTDDDADSLILDANDNIHLLWGYCGERWEKACHRIVYDNDTVSASSTIWDGVASYLDNDFDYCKSGISYDGKVMFTCAYYGTAEYELSFVYSYYNGSSWSNTSTIVRQQEYSWHGSTFTTDKTGKTYFVYANNTSLDNNEYEVKYVSTNDLVNWSVSTTLFTGYGNTTSSLYGSSIMQSVNRYSFSPVPSKGFFFPYGTYDELNNASSSMNAYFSDDFELFSARPTSTYDANRPTSTFKAYKGASWVLAYNTSTGMWIDKNDNETPTPFSLDMSQWTNKGVEFTATEYGRITSTNSQYATTTPSTTSGLLDPFLANINKFEIYATETPAMSKNYIPYFIGMSNNITSTNASATSAMDDRMFMENFCTKKLVEVDANLNGSGTSSGSILTTTTFPWTISNKSCFAKPTSTALGTRWQTNFYIFSPDVWTDCYNQSNSTDKLLCYKMHETSTGAEGGLSGQGCEYQIGIEDIWSQCTTTAGDISTGCYTDYCGDGGQAGKCGYYVDNAQHNCPQCYGCRSSDTGEDSCEAKSTGAGATPDYGCGGGIGGECMSCNNGTCDSTLCVGYQCGCLPGQICDNSGVCQNEAPPTCNDACQGLGYSFGGCFPSSRCTALGWYVDGNSPDCYSPRICCCHN